MDHDEAKLDQLDVWFSDTTATSPGNLYNVDPADPRRFYAVEEFDVPSQ